MLMMTKSKKPTENELLCTIQIDTLLHQKTNVKKLVKHMVYYQMLRRGIVTTKVMILMIWKDTAMDTRVTLIQTRYSKPSSAKEEEVVVPNISPSVVKAVCQEDFLSSLVKNVLSRIVYIIRFSYLLL